MRRTILLPASVGIALLLACAVAILAALASAPTATAASIDHGASFAVRCDFSHRAQVDPIRVPGVPSGHMHDFFGNINTGASSTYQSMTAGGATTTCSRPEDTAGYWIPTVSWKDSKGKQTTLTANRGVFYKGGPQGLPDRPAFRSRPEAHKRSAHHVVLRDKRQRRWLRHPAHTVQRWRAQLEDRLPRLRR